MAPLENMRPTPAEPSSTPAASPSSKRAAVLAAATKVFMEQGFGSASMDEVARQAGVSKATIYSHFESKHALFGAIITGRCQAMIPAIAHTAPDDRPPEEALTAVGRQFLDNLLSGEALPLYRVVLAEAPRFPELGRVFYESGPNRIADALAAYFMRQQARGTLAVPDARLAAEQFFGMVLGHNHLRTVLSIATTPPGPTERERIVASAVRLFLHGATHR